MSGEKDLIGEFVSRLTAEEKSVIVLLGKNRARMEEAVALLRTGFREQYERVMEKLEGLHGALCCEFRQTLSMAYLYVLGDSPMFRDEY